MRRLLVVAIGCVAGLNPAFGQNFQDGSRWFNVSSWKVMFTGSGKGEGPLYGGGCSASYDNVQSADVTAVLKGSPPMYPFGDWAGQTSAGLSLTETTYEVCGSHSCTSTLSAHDTSAPLELLIDSTGNGTYSVIFEPMTVSSSTCSGPPMAWTDIWGPEYNADGSDTGTGLGGQIPLPAKGVDLEYTVPTYAESSHRWSRRLGIFRGNSKRPVRLTYRFYCGRATRHGEATTTTTRRKRHPQ
jgi:hypothetical protein